MPTPDLITSWRKSSYSGSNSNCVEVGSTVDLLAVRDSKNPAGPLLTVSPAAWTAFTTATPRDHA